MRILAIFSEPITITKMGIILQSLGAENENDVPAEMVQAVGDAAAVVARRFPNYSKEEKLLAAQTLFLVCALGGSVRILGE